MKILLVVITSFVIIQVNGGWAHYGPGIGNGRGNNHGRGPPWGYPQQINQNNNAFGSEVEWVCQNPRTNDIMVIASDNTQQHQQHQQQQQQQQQQQRYPDRGPWWQWQNVPPDHQNHHQNSGNSWTQPIIIVQEPTRTDGNQLSLTTPQMPETHNNNDGSSGNNNNNNNNNNYEPHTTPHYHGGEGLIDIRLGA